ncbi:MAG: alpha/beta hydrolase fold domain-containing protein [Candidatus Lokiarchaeota archaeon]|nr:alpha/beta hydrolase fold domain-containing protein [Candidatus Lokiarchaeota archaeon]
MNRTSQIFIKILGYIVLLLNFISIVLGIVYLTIPIYSIHWDITGWLFIGTLILNSITAFYLSKNLNKSIKRGNKINFILYGYFGFTILAMGLLLGGNFILQSSYSYSIIDNLGSYTAVYGTYFGLLIFGMFLGYIIIYYCEWPDLWSKRTISDLEPTSMSVKTKRILKLILKIICIVGFVFFILMNILMFFGTANLIFGWLGVAAGLFALFYLFMSLSSMFLLLLVTDRKTKPIQFYSYLIIGLVTSSIFAAPLITTPSMIENADASFTAAFGEDWRDQIDNETAPYMMKSPFSIPAYFLGLSHGLNACIVKKDVSFYNGTSGVDKGLRLYFDAYLPPNKGEDLPGGNSTIIRIHGGGWVMGDKGLGNMMAMNKYFASQGYVVFDIQYGLYNGSWQMPLITPDYVMGNFSVDDMLRHIGKFTQYLIANHTKYGAKLDSIFVSGGSAGGHLTCATALAIANGSYGSIFGSGLSIKGLVPFYPANVLEKHKFLDGSSEFLDPLLLIDEDSPPCLVFQGEQDGLVNPSVSAELKTAYTEAGLDNCSIIYMPFAGHGADIHFSGYYNMIFLYYMERFLYLFR